MTPALAPVVTRPLRVLLVWCPDWSVVAVQRSQGINPDDQLALVDKGVVVACSATAQAEGVTPGLRVRQAQHRCPDMTVLPHDPALELQVFEPIMRAIEETVPGVHLVRAGLAAVRAKGASRFYGGDRAAAMTLLTRLRPYAGPDVRVAVADGLFAAEQAAFTTTAESAFVSIPEGTSAEFLAHLPVTAVEAQTGDKRMTNLLRRMGIRTLGDLTAIPRADVHARLGEGGWRAHQLASGEDAPVLNPRDVPRDLSVRVAFEPASEQVEHIIAECEPHIDDLVARLTSASLVCNEIRLSIHTESGPADQRSWRHPWHFTAAEIADRVRWQLEDVATTSTGDDDPFLSRAVITIEIAPESVDDMAHHAQGLWGERPDEHVVQTLTGLQHQLGYHGVLVSTISGGRLLHERRVLRPWGDALPDAWERRVDQPWPGGLPGPAPATVFAQARPVLVLAADRTPIRIDQRGEVSAPLGWLSSGQASEGHRVTGWAGPWPVRQRWWRAHHRFDRFQVVDDRSQAWLLLTDGTQWWAEARYD
ncbi:DNA polymerase Y family protein [Luteipulveratus mongoliensis]|uniref:UmuC domain-containing protein n=1 Tax=Luteipulveratus mongoliensis TaxID=571913 RepID=A0A0K1JH62_9MICO|nr:DNA polymerase Y family protein [Luteipulveratus mongoliensis]AKU16041.1 hypothetical protein VV02_09525 [Luteipulveratus mongoliensis]